MADYMAMYRKLFAAQADAIEALQEITEQLIEAHRQVEKLCMNAAEDIVVLKRCDDGRLSREEKRK